MFKYISATYNYYLSSYKGFTSAIYLRLFITFMHATAIGVCFFLSLYLVKFQHFKINVAGLVVSSYGLGTALGGIVSGKFSDKYSNKKITSIALVIESSCFYLLSYFTNFYLLVGVIFLLGCASYAFKTTNILGITELVSNEKDKLQYISFIQIASNLGIGVAGFIVSGVALISFKYVFLIASILLFSSAILLSFQKNNFTNKKIIIKNEVKAAKNNSIILLVLGCLFCMGLIIGQRNVAYAVYLHHHFTNQNFHMINFLISLNPLLIILFQAPLTHFISQFNKINMMGLGAFLMGFGMFFLSFFSFFFCAIISCLIYTFGEMIFFSISQFISYQHGASNKKGLRIGLYQMTYAISLIVGPSVGGYVYFHYGSNTPWVISGLLGIICVLYCIFINKSFD